jgi:hypothetical protein
MRFDFTIVGLPRSRTYWFSRLLTYGNVHCFHDYHAYKYKVPLRKRLGNASFTPWQEHSGRIVIIERDRIEAEVSFLNYIDEPIGFESQIFDKAEDHLSQLTGLRVRYEDINARIFDILDYIGVDIPIERLEEFIDKELHSPDTSPENSKVAYA